MEQTIPEGRFNLILEIPEKFLSAFGQSSLIQDYSINKTDLVCFEEASQPYFEVNLVDADIKEVVTGLIEAKIEADLQVLPLYQDEHYQTRVSFNAYVRNVKNQTLSYINSKDEEDLAYELKITLGQLNEQGIHEADAVILNRINELHSVGWLNG